MSTPRSFWRGTESGAEIAVAGFGRMDVVGGRTRGGEGGGQFAAHKARFAEAADGDTSGATGEGAHGPVKGIVKGIAQGPDQLRQYTASAILCDEMAFWDKAEQTWGALKPTVQGGGQVTMISSAGPGFFQRLVEGRLTDDRR